MIFFLMEVLFMYIDTHCHVFSEYYDDIEEIVRKCKKKIMLPRL